MMKARKIGILVLLLITGFLFWLFCTPTGPVTRDQAIRSAKSKLENYCNQDHIDMASLSGPRTLYVSIDRSYTVTWWSSNHVFDVFVNSYGWPEISVYPTNYFHKAIGVTSRQSTNEGAGTTLKIEGGE